MSIARTRRHYESHPFVEGGARRVTHWTRRMRGPLPDCILGGATVLDVGCGSAEIALGLAERGARPVCLDLTARAAARARRRGLAACQANALALPFRTGAFDHAVSIGVLHHTPDTRGSLREIVRVTRPRGRIVVLLYARWTPYHAIYTLSAPLRGRVPVERLDRVPRWFLAAMRFVVACQVGQRLGDDQLRRLLADQLWTPQASFHSCREVRRWAAELRLTEVRRHALLCHGNIFTWETPAVP